MDGSTLRYEVNDDELAHGSSLGNPHGWISTGTDGRVQSLFSTDVGEEVAGPLMVRYYSAQASVAECRGKVCALEADCPLAPVGTGRFVLHPAYQEHVFRLPGDVEVVETIFMPRAEAGERGHDCVVYCMVALQNLSGERRELNVRGFVRLRGTRRTPVVAGAYEEKLGAILAWEPDENADWVRTFCSTRRPRACAITSDFGLTSEVDFARALNNDTSARGDVLGCLEVPVALPVGARERFAFVLAFTPEGRPAAENLLKQLVDADAVLAECVAHVQGQLDVCRVHTPDPVINEGAAWAKINMTRVLTDYPEGESFTNEPGGSSNVVTRDVAWFIYGCDHFRPETSRRMLAAIARMQYESGKVPEYYDARTGRVEDYGLNINDATPLYVLSVNHHVRSTGDFGFLEKLYDSVSAAASYILSQRDERGLVYCSGDGVEVWGICSWRNVIPNYRINGAVTEINAECAAALRAMGHMADNLGRPSDAKRFSAEAAALTEAINEHLLDKERQLYLLNIDKDGERHTDVTADELFPVLFRVADDEVAFRIIRRLNSPDFWTPAGMRTTSRLDPFYDPARYAGLIGGVWPGVTWWYAFAAARYHPEFMVRALHASYAHYSRDPRVFNTVPGQFGEWFDGESLVNRGMRLSPWEPPRFLWAAVEGVCGMMVGPDAPGIRPLLPPDWLWVAATRVCYHGGHVTFFAARKKGRLHVYANTEFQGGPERDVFDEDLSDGVRISWREGIHPVAFGRKDGRRLVALGTCRQTAQTFPVDLSALLKPDAKYKLRQYSSERAEWSPSFGGKGSRFANLAVRIEPRGYHLLEFTPGG